MILNDTLLPINIIKLKGKNVYGLKFGNLVFFHKSNVKNNRGKDSLGNFFWFDISEINFTKYYRFRAYRNKSFLPYKSVLEKQALKIIEKFTGVNYENTSLQQREQLL